MIGSMIGILLAGLVVGCAIEEQQSSGALTVNPNSNDVEIPEGLTAASLDLNKDGIINIQDLVIMSKFFGQEVVDETSDTESSGVKLPKLPEYIYAVIELEQIGVWDKNKKDAVVDADYASNLQVAMRIQTQKRDRDEVATDREKAFRSKYKPQAGFADLLDVYFFPEIKIKTIQEHSKKPEEKVFVFNSPPKEYGLQGPFRSLMWTWWTPQEGRRDKFVTYSQTRGITSSGTPSVLFFEILYSNNINNIKELSDVEPSPSTSTTVESMKNSLHIGNSLPNNAEGEEYTDTYIRKFILVYNSNNTFRNNKNDLYRGLSYKFRRGENEKGYAQGRLLHKTMTPALQQQIKAEHFPEDL